MNLLAALVPGFREFRTPFTAGAMWLAAFVLALYPHRERLAPQYPQLVELYHDLPTYARPALLLSVTYLIGVVATRVVLGIAWNFDREGETGFTHRQIRFRGRLLNLADHLYGWWLWLVEIDYRGGSTYRALEASMPDAPGWVARALIPDMLVQSELKVARARLAQEAPVMFEELDRAHAEGVFRLAVAPPLVVLAVALSPLLGWGPGLITIAISFVASLVLIRDAAHRFLESNGVLDNALEAGIVRLPYLDGLVDAISKSERSPEATVIEWCLHTDRPWVQDVTIERFERVLEWSKAEYGEKLKSELGPATLTHMNRLKDDFDPMRGKLVDRFTDRRIASALYLTDVLRPGVKERLAKRDLH